MVPTYEHGYQTIELEALPSSCRYTSVAWKIIEIIPNWLFYVMVIDFSDPEVRLPKHMKIAQIVEQQSHFPAFGRGNQNVSP